MSYALVGSAGTAVQGASGGAPVITWGAGESRTAGNVLVLAYVGNSTTNSTTLPGAISGWSIGKQIASGALNGSGSASIYYTIATGGDAVPTLPTVANWLFAGQLYEFSGNVASLPLDQTGSNQGAGTSLVTTNGAGDALAGELVFGCSGVMYNGVPAVTLSDAFNNGATANSTHNNATSTNSHYIISYGFTTSKASADTYTNSRTTGGISTGASALCSFKGLPTIPNVTIPPYLPY